MYRERNRIERMICHLKINRAIATRYDKLARRSGPTWPGQEGRGPRKPGNVAACFKDGVGRVAVGAAQVTGTVPMSVDMTKVFSREYEYGERIPIASLTGARAPVILFCVSPLAGSSASWADSTVHLLRQARSPPAVFSRVYAMERGPCCHYCLPRFSSLEFI